MFNTSRLQEILVQYKKDFIPWHWGEEEYKWKAVKCFQDNWDIDAVDFADMLSRSIARAGNLLDSMNKYPAGRIKMFAEKAPEEVRAMFLDLFDEKKDVYDRIRTFKASSAKLLDKYGDGLKHHYQTENAMSVYLWLRYPDEYYIYKFGIVKDVSKKLESSYTFKMGDYTHNLRSFYDFYNEICDELKKDTELIALFRSQLTDECYPDPELKTLTGDVGYYIAHDYKEWFPSQKEYDPGLSTADWKALLQNKDVFTQSSLEIMKRMKDSGGTASFDELAAKYGKTKEFYWNESDALGKRVSEKTGCPVLTGIDEGKKWEFVLYVGRHSENKKNGFIWKLREELAKAVDQAVLPPDNPGEETHEPGYWWLNANPRMWSFSNLAVGEVQAFTLYNDSGHKRKIFQNFIDAKAGDLVIGYEVNPVKKITALLKVSTHSDGQKIYFEKTEGLVSPIDYKTLKDRPELEKMEFFQTPNGTLFRLKKDEYECIMDLVRDVNPKPQPVVNPAYTKKDFLSEVYMTEEKYDRLAGVLENKKNIILQGAPGVGKTFAAKRLAYSLMGEKDDSRIEFVQFHQNYSYEDFMMGYRPSENGFELKHGVFYRFCQKAANQPDKKFFFIIDEINRGNLSKIFGELLMLIENDYRGQKVTLAYDGSTFYVPENLYIIGMMNTADRSLAMIDYALRRRFSFFEIEPAFESEGFQKYQQSLDNETFDELIRKIIKLNKQIEGDKSLGKGFRIGHSYFCGRTKETCTDEWMRDVVDYDILPMLAEYWFDDADRIRQWDDALHGVFQ